MERSGCQTVSPSAIPCAESPFWSPNKKREASQATRVEAVAFNYVDLSFLEKLLHFSAVEMREAYGAPCESSSRAQLIFDHVGAFTASSVDKSLHRSTSRQFIFSGDAHIN